MRWCTAALPHHFIQPLQVTNQRYQCRNKQEWDERALLVDTHLLSHWDRDIVNHIDDHECQVSAISWQRATNSCLTPRW